jgi:exopolysaccharide biosynthesis polyprenyl glycosylphosphotransferase
MNTKFGHRYFNAIVPLIDLCIVYLSIIFSFYWFRDSLDAFASNWYAFITISPFIGIAYLITSNVMEFDKPKDFSFFGVAYTAVLTVFILFLVTMAISFLTREFAYPRRIILISSVIQIFLLSGWHLFVNKLYLKSNRKRTVLIIGYQKGKELAYKLIGSNGMWSNIQHICEPGNKKAREYINQCDVTFITEDIDEDTKQKIVLYCVENNRTVLYEPRNAEILLFNAAFTQIDDSPLLNVHEFGLSPLNEMMKRILDVFICSIAAVILFIPGLIVFLILKTGGSAFYSQERVTRGGKIFKIYKFRTMIENAEALSGPVLANEKDSRITKIGAILRSTRLDEIPQIYNILVGEMTIVGPRPERPFFVEQFKKEIPEYALRHRTKAGLTGLAQIQGKYNTSVKDKLKYDLLYINGYSFALDVKLIIQTLNILLRKSSTEGLKTHEDLSDKVELLYRKSEDSQDE